LIQLVKLKVIVFKPYEQIVYFYIGSSCSFSNKFKEEKVSISKARKK
jgi:hypothetical protein